MERYCKCILFKIHIKENGICKYINENSIRIKIYFDKN